MKIKKINELKNVGILNEESFVNNFNLTYTEKEVSKCAAKVLIHGENGSGKTTFSNILRAIELSQKNEDNNIVYKLKNIVAEEDIKVKIEMDDGNCIKYNSELKKWENKDLACIRVFNQDYIDKNIDFNDFRENKFEGKLESEKIDISKEKKEYNTVEKELNFLKKEKENNESVILNKIDEINNNIKNLTDYNCKLKESISEYAPKHDKDNSLNLEKLIINYKQYRDVENYRGITKINFNTDIDITKIRELLEYEEDRTKVQFVDEILMFSVEKREWIDRGLEFIDNAKNQKCPFCEENISNNKIVEKYRFFKESEGKKIENELKNFLDTIKIFKELPQKVSKTLLELEKYDGLLEDKIKFDFQREFENDIEDISNIINNKILSVYIKSMDFAKIEEKWTTINKLKLMCKKIDSAIQIIDKKMAMATSELTKIRKKIRTALKNDVEFEMRIELKKNNELIEKIKLKDKELKEKKKIYDNKLAESNQTIKAMNEWLIFFGIEKYKIDKEFNLVYKNKNLNGKGFILSNGEISAIAFSYYIASLIVGLTQEERNKLIIVIDDPVDSVDYNRIYSFATTIKIIQSKIKAGNNPQLIVLTHNMLLYNILIQTNFMKNANSKTYIMREKNEEGLIINKDNNYKETLFVKQLSEIIEIANIDEEIDIRKAYVYNNIRTVIENLGYFIDPSYTDNSSYGKLKTFFELNDLKFEKLLYIVNSNSHNEPMLNIESWFDSKLLKECCVIISEMIQAKFIDLYNFCKNKK